MRALGPSSPTSTCGYLHPGNFVRKHLFEGLDDDADGAVPGMAESEGEYMAGRTATATLAREETPPFDPEAT